MAELAKAYIQIVPSAKGIKGTLSNELGGAAEASGKSAGNKIGSLIKGAIAAAGIGAALKSAISEGAALEQSFGGLDTLYGSAATEAKKFAKEASAAGISANSYAEQAVSFGASLKQALGGDAVAAAKAANTAILDMADNSAKMGTDITSIQNAYQGFAKQNYTMLDNLKLGYGGTKTEMERLLADATKLTGIKYDITNLSDVYSAIHVIQTDLGLTGVAAQEASTTLSGSFGAMKAAAQNFLGYLVIGEDVTAAMDTLVKSVATFLGGNLFPAISNILKSLPPAIGNLIGQISPEFIANGLSMLSNMLKGITNNLDKVIQTATTLVKNLLSGISKKLPEIIAMGVTLIGKLVTGLLKAIPDIIREIPTIFKNIVSGFKKQNWAKIGRDIINGIISGVKNMGGALMSAARQAGQNALSSIKNALGIHSPSKVFDQEVGQMIGKGLIAGIQKSTLSIPAIMTGIAEDTVAPATDTISTEAASTSTDSSIADAIREGFAAWSNNQAVELSINMDGTTVAKKIYKPFMKLMKQKGATNG